MCPSPSPVKKELETGARGLHLIGAPRRCTHKNSSDIVTTNGWNNIAYPGTLTPFSARKKKAHQARGLLTGFNMIGPTCQKTIQIPKTIHGNATSTMTRTNKKNSQLGPSGPSGGLSGPKERVPWTPLRVVLSNYGVN